MASSNKSQSKQTGSSFVDPAQQPYLDSLRSGVTGAFAGLPSQQPLFDQASRGAGILANTNFTDPASLYGPTRQSLAGFTGNNPYAAKLGASADQLRRGESPGVDRVIGNLGEDINRTLQRMLGGAGGVDTASQLSGTFGGGRNEVERGIATEGALNAFGTQAGQIRLNDYQQRQQQALTADATAGGLYGTGQQQNLGAIGLGGQLNEGQLGAGVTQGLAQGNLQTQAGALGFSPFNNSLTLWQQLANVIGNPTVLNKSRGKASGSGFEIFQTG